MMICARSSADRVPGYEPVGRGFESPRARGESKPNGLLFLIVTEITGNGKYGE